MKTTLLMFHKRSSSARDVHTFSYYFSSEILLSLLLRPSDRSPKNPVVFCHGLLGFDSVTIGPAIAPFHVAHWRGIQEVLEANGAEVLVTRVPATSSPIDRAKVLEQKISEVYPGRNVHLIGM